MKCTLMPGIESISGSIKCKRGVKLTFKHYTKNGRNETRAYVMHKQERKSKPSEKEIAQRRKFAQAANYFASLSEPQLSAYFLEFRKDNYQLGGKTYATLRGYVMARFFNGDLIVNCEL